MTMTRIYKATTVKDPPQNQIGDGEAFESMGQL